MIEYEIVKITDKNGNDRTDGRYLLRIGRRCNVEFNGCGKPLYIHYIPNNLGILTTSKVTDISLELDNIKVRTMDSIYYFKKILI